MTDGSQFETKSTWEKKERFKVRDRSKVTLSLDWWKQKLMDKEE